MSMERLLIKVIKGSIRSSKKKERARVTKYNQMLREEIKEEKRLEKERYKELSKLQKEKTRAVRLKKKTLEKEAIKNKKDADKKWIEKNKQHYKDSRIIPVKIFVEDFDIRSIISYF